MNDYAGAALNHLGEQATIQPDGRIKILIDGLLPELIRDGNESSAGRGRSSDVMDKNVHAFKPAQHFADDMRRAFGSRDVRLDEMRCSVFSGGGPCRYDNGRASFQKSVRDSLARAFCAAGHEYPFAVELARVIRVCA